jgi:hypothetical protein
MRVKRVAIVGQIMAMKCWNIVVYSELGSAEITNHDVMTIIG